MPNNLDDIARRVQHLRDRLPLLIGNEVVNFALDNFDKQGFDTGTVVRKWQPRKHGDRPGGAILVGKQSGRLRRSIRQLRRTDTSVWVGSDEVYSGIHNEGGTLRVTVTPKSRRYFWAMYYETKKDYWKWMALTKKPQLTIKMPERRFLGNSAELDRRIIRLIERELEKIFK